MKYYLYKLIDTQNKNFYIGVHTTNNMDDGYMGSGVRLNDTIRSRCIKEILEYFDNEADMYAREKEVVNRKLVNNPNCYNMCIGGYGGDTISHHPNKENIIKRSQETLKNKPLEERTRINKLKARRGSLNGMFGTSRKGEEAPMYGKKHKIETKRLISKKAKKRAKHPDYKNPNKGKKISEEQKESIRQRNSRTYVFVKDGIEITIKNLASFCREHNLNETSMRHVAAKRYKQHNGYYCD